MPRDGSTIYHKPFPDVINNTTIESAVYNGFVNDLESDMNNPRPILSGGTGANNARDAMLNLKGEIALQSVTNFDSHPWVTGSFYSAAGATAAPNAVDAFTGDYFQNLTGDHATIHARANTGTPFGRLFIRQKVAGVWGGWFDIDKPLDDKKVNRVGDVMTGDLFIDSTNPALVLDKAASANASYLVGQTNALARWRLDLGDSTPEGGTQAGSNFTLRRYANTGALIDTPLSIARDTGMVTMPGSHHGRRHYQHHRHRDVLGGAVGNIAQYRRHSYGWRCVYLQQRPDRQQRRNNRRHFGNDRDVLFWSGRWPMAVAQRDGVHIFWWPSGG